MQAHELSIKKVKVQKAVLHFIENNPGAVPQLSPPFKICFKLKDGSYVTHDIVGLLLAHSSSKKKRSKTTGGGAA